jgi:type VI secretion system protein ImpF
MSRLDPNKALRPSFFDRLIDVEMQRPQAVYNVEQMVAVVYRDLEDLLNTRQTHAGMPEHFQETHHSVAAYGLPDLTTLNAVSASDREEIGRVLETIIARFEPRLRTIRAAVIEEPESKERTHRFRVEARLALDPAPEVAFDTILELATGRYQVRPKGG